MSDKAGSAILDQLAKITGSCEGQLSIVVEDYNGSRGSAAFNDALYKVRADKAAAYLREKGLSAEQISSQGLDSAKPIAPNSTRAGRAKTGVLSSR